MASKRRILVLLSAALTIILAGCGSSSSTNNSSSQAAAVSIAFQSKPPAALTVNDVAQLEAVVTNDPNNYGVDWSVTCAQAGNCGALSAQHSNSGDSVSYFPPSVFNGNTTSVNIVAFATADHSKNALASITVTAFGGQLSGTYVFQATGTDTDTTTGIQGPYHLAGVVNLDGNGGVKLVKAGSVSIGGEQTFSNSSRSGAATITGGSYFLGADGRGTLTLNTSDATIGASGVETFTLAFLSHSQVLIAQADGSASASGTMELQTSVAAPSNGYAFAVRGSDGSPSPLPMVFGGVFNIDQAAGGISGTGSLADADHFGTVTNCPAPGGVTGTVSAPDTLGSVKLNFTTCFTANPIQFTGYIVDASHIKLVETDINAAGTGSGFSTSGTAVGQGALTGKFSTFSGAYVFGNSGLDVTGFAASLSSSGTLVAGKPGTVTGTMDEYLVSGTGISDGFTGTYTIDPSGSGRVDMTIAFDNPANPPGPEFIYYQTGSGNPPVEVEFNTALVAAGSGLAYPQAAAPLTFDGKYGFEITQMVGYALETDLTGEMTADKSTNTLAGSVDGFGIVGDQLTGTFNSPAANGRFSGVLSAPNASGTGLAGPAPVEFYLIDNNHGFFVETDLAYVFLGSFAARTPVCPTCP